MTFRKYCLKRTCFFAVLVLLMNILLFMAPLDVAAAHTRTIKDMTGRQVTVPQQINKVYGTGANAAVYLYTMAPDKLAGWNFEFNEAEKAFIPAKYQNLPVLGNFSGAKTNTNLEALIKTAPDVLVVASTALDQADKEDADKLAAQTGIPVVIIDGSLENIPEAYLFLGNLLNMKERAKSLYSYSYHAINGVKYRGIPENKQVTVFFGNGLKSLDTAPKGSSHAEALELVKAKNVAVLSASGAGRIEVGLEQVIKWNPQVVLVNGEPAQSLSADAARNDILTNKNWSTIQAVKDKQVYTVPKAPFAWVDRPPGPNRLIGLKWLGKTIYPDYYSFDLNKEIKIFYRLFYHLDLTDAQINTLLTN